MTFVGRLRRRGGGTSADPVAVETLTPTPTPKIPLVDTDGDSVADIFDLCSNTQPGETVDDKGCSTGEISGQSSGSTSWGIGGGGAVIGMFIDNHNAQKIYIATQDNILSSTDGEQYTVYFTPIGHKIHRFNGGSTATDITLSYASDEGSKAISASLAQGLKDDDVRATYCQTV